MKELLPLSESVLVFLHIKKTGGISLQKLIQSKYVGKFYGSNHSALKKKKHLNKAGIKYVLNGSAIANHWVYDDFHLIKERCNFITVIRDPVDRVVSAYNFYLQHHQSGMSFLRYIREKKNINLFSKSISDIELMSEVYLFDTFNKSIIKSRIFDKSGSVEHLNKTNYRYRPSKVELDEFIELNKTDIDLNELVKRRLK